MNKTLSPGYPYYQKSHMVRLEINTFLRLSHETAVTPIYLCCKTLGISLHYLISFLPCYSLYPVQVILQSRFLGSLLRSQEKSIVI